MAFSELKSFRKTFPNVDIKLSHYKTSTISELALFQHVHWIAYSLPHGNKRISCPFISQPIGIAHLQNKERIIVTTTSTALDVSESNLTTEESATTTTMIEESMILDESENTPTHNNNTISGYNPMEKEEKMLIDYEMDDVDEEEDEEEDAKAEDGVGMTKGKKYSSERHMKKWSQTCLYPRIITTPMHITFASLFKLINTARYTSKLEYVQYIPPFLALQWCEELLYAIDHLIARLV